METIPNPALPPPAQSEDVSIGQYIQQDPTLSHFEQFVSSYLEFSDALSDTSGAQYTLFAPTNTAMEVGNSIMKRRCFQYFGLFK